MEEHKLKLTRAVLWAAAYFAIMLFYTFLDVAIWEKLFPSFSDWLNIITIIICICGFIYFLKKSAPNLKIISNITPLGILLAVGCSILFYLLLDNCLDPILESIFPASEQNYQEAILSLVNSPVTSFLQVCIIAPIIEESLMRGFVLEGLKKNYGRITALLVSAILFALLHFNMVQTFSALLCGIILGMLYLKSSSVFCCIIAHCGYNFLSYCVMIYPYIDR